MNLYQTFPMNENVLSFSYICIVYVYPTHFPNIIAFFCPTKFLPPSPAVFSPWEIWICNV